MFYKYEIRNNGIEDVLYLYLTMNYEFSKELGHSASNNEMTRRTKNFIKNNGIDYKGNKVYLVIDGIVVKSLDIRKDDKEIEVLKEELFYSNDYYFVTIKLDNDVTIEVTLKEYLLGVLASIYIPGLQLEVLKSLAILYRSYAYKEMCEKRIIMAFNEFCTYRPISYYKLSWINNFDDVYKQLLTAIQDTDCLFTSYNQYYTLPFVHYCNDGKTIASNKYGYLSSVNSLWDLASPYYINITDFSYDELSRLLHTSINNDSEFKVIDIDDNKFINKLQIDNAVFIADDLIKILSLKSRAINIIVNNDYVRFINKGWGYFMGLSIYGADAIAKNGCDCISIIKYYFPNITISKYIKELS